MEHLKIIEINGIKLEVDMRTAKRIEQYRVGDKIKVLVKTYSDSFESYPGVIAGFDMFEQRPSITVAYIKQSYASASLEFRVINKDSKDIEICSAQDYDLSYEKGDVINNFNREIEKKRNEILDIEAKKNYFIEKFGKHFE